MSETTHNLDRALDVLEREAAEMEQAAVKAIITPVKRVHRDMVFGPETPVKTGYYSASMHLAVNEPVSGGSRRRMRRKAGRHAFTAQRRERVAEAARRLGEIKSLSGLDNIKITNTAPHAHFIEGGTRNMPAKAIFAKAGVRLNSMLEQAGQNVE